MWEEWTLSNKDLEVEKTVIYYLEQQLLHELEIGQKLKELRFTRNIYCLSAYKKWICHLNYPSCDEESKRCTILSIYLYIYMYLSNNNNN